MILTVTPNPALDLTWRVERLRPGHTHRVPSGAARAGGKGLNVARVLHETAVDVLAFTTVGGATGEEFRSELEASGVPHALVAVSAPTRRSVAVVDESAGEVSVLNEHGTPPNDVEAARFWSDAARLASAASAVAVSGSLPRGEGVERLADAVVGIVAAGVPVLVDTSGPGILAAARAGATALKPNAEELAEATGIADPVAGARALIALGARVVVASLGEDGLVVVHADGRAVRARFPERVHGNATGAGDAVAAAVVRALSADPGLDAADAVSALARTAAAWGAAAVAMPLAGETDPQVRARADDVVVTQLHA